HQVSEELVRSHDLILLPETTWNPSVDDRHVEKRCVAAPPAAIVEKSCRSCRTLGRGAKLSNLRRAAPDQFIAEKRKDGAAGEG
ncbi:MAG: hypothetical protein D6741_08560, partial [Planctomycetota bacterium]